jgi:hypothetical protein
MSPGAAAGAACVSSRILDVIDRVGGVRTAVLAVGIAVLTGARTFTAITTWAHDLTVRCAPCSGLGRVSPSESTTRQTVQATDGETLDRGLPLSAWLAARSKALPAAPAGDRQRREERRRPRGTDGGPVHLLAEDFGER